MIAETLTKNELRIRKSLYIWRKAPGPLTQMKRYEDIDQGLRYYEIPTIEKMNSFMRWFINTGIPDKNARERTITLYIDKDPFKKSLQIPDEKQIYAMDVDRSGNVLWRATGPYDEANGKSLQQLLEKSAVTHATAVPAPLQFLAQPSTRLRTVPESRFRLSAIR
jgi:hypothetical protein